MDSAYDHIQEESYPQDPTKQQAGGDSTHQQTTSNINAEIQDAYKAISSSPWAARLGGFLGNVKKQGEQYYDSASKQYAPLSKTATAGVSNFITHARNLSAQAGETSGPKTDSTAKDSSTTEQAKDDPDAHPDRPESLPADIVKEAEGILSLFRSEATKRLKDIEKAEDAADEALLKFGSNIRNFLRDAVTIAPPESGSEADKNGDVLFESKDSSGKKVVHATRFDAQLHVIHSTLDSFLKDPTSPQWEAWKSSFDVEKKTDAIAKDLEKHQELRSAMEKCVPEKVDYATFWCRYYFLRHVIESEEQRRREMLKASTPADEEEVGWDEDSDEEGSSQAPTSHTTSAATEQPSNRSATSLAASVKTLKPTEDKPAEDELLKPAQPRRSHDEKSVADSDASYDLVSGVTSRAPSRAPGSPQEKKKAAAEESDEEDWE
ncbi:Nn.00g060450.m01.CDS01 [Neocucurbitaria sp. VM-36]